MKDNIKVKSTYLTITEELVLQCEPQVACGTATLPKDLLKIGSDHAGEPAEDDNIHPSPRRIVGEGIAGEDVVGKGVHHVSAINIRSRQMS
jgi:hypothetical protein